MFQSILIIIIRSGSALEFNLCSLINKNHLEYSKILISEVGLQHLVIFTYATYDIFCSVNEACVIRDLCVHLVI